VCLVLCLCHNRRAFAISTAPARASINDDRLVCTDNADTSGCYFVHQTLSPLWTLPRRSTRRTGRRPHCSYTRLTRRHSWRHVVSRPNRIISLPPVCCAIVNCEISHACLHNSCAEKGGQSRGTPQQHAHNTILGPFDAVHRSTTTDSHSVLQDQQVIVVGDVQVLGVLIKPSNSM
jgi:hypothetical protein